MSFLPPPDHKDQIEQWIDDHSQLSAYPIGRKADNAIVLSHGKISGQHARLIQCTDSSFLLEDLTSKHGTFVNDVRITRKIIDRKETVRLADLSYTLDQLLAFLPDDRKKPPELSSPVHAVLNAVLPDGKEPLDFRDDFAQLQQVYEQYPQLRRSCRNREKMIRTGSIILSSLVGVSAVLTTGGGALPFLQIMSGAGLSMLIPTLCSTLLSTDEKLEIIDKEFRLRYRCPNPSCRDPFGTREWDLLAQQKSCRRCQAVWVS